uniref:Neur_chan_LBD domain-containing protein n=1 Tax=Macrostomum lignano TaxID=282301 RepID=A0A1I8JNQ8_9PLAT
MKQICLAICFLWTQRTLIGLVEAQAPGDPPSSRADQLPWAEVAASIMKALRQLCEAGKIFSATRTPGPTDRPHATPQLSICSKQHLLKGYDITSRPVRQDANPGGDKNWHVSVPYILDTPRVPETQQSWAAQKAAHSWRQLVVRRGRTGRRRRGGTSGHALNLLEASPAPHPAHGNLSGLAKKIVAGLENSARCESAFARRQVENHPWPSFQNERHQTISAQVSIRVFPDPSSRISASIADSNPQRPMTSTRTNMNTNAIVEKNGNVMWTFPIVVKMYCTLDVRYFPFDTQECNMTFVSWTYDGFQADQKVYYNARNQEWKVTGITPYQQFNKYPAGESPFPVIHFTIHMYRRCLFYVINLICPCLLIYFVSFLAFYLPIESGEKVNLEITVLLALVVFLLMRDHAAHPGCHPDSGLLFTVTMTMVALSVVMAVIVTQVFFSQPQERPPATPMRLSRL